MDALVAKRDDKWIQWTTLPKSCWMVFIHNRASGWKNSVVRCLRRSKVTRKEGYPCGPSLLFYVIVVASPPVQNQLFIPLFGCGILLYNSVIVISSTLYFILLRKGAIRWPLNFHIILDVKGNWAHSYQHNRPFVFGNQLLCEDTRWLLW
jgi:hypothetical protein